MSTPLEQDREERLDEVIAGYLRDLQSSREQRRPEPDRQQLLNDHPDLAGDLASFFADQDGFKDLAAPLRTATLAAVPPLPRRFGNYQLLEELARGGMGVVYRARQYLGDGQSSNGPYRLVALKFLLGGAHASEADLRRFRTEAEVVASLDHPHIVPIHEVGTDDGCWFLSMKLIEGGHLGNHRERYRSDPRSAVQVLAAVADAVHHAHQRGVLHRDLKPSNILLEQCPDSGEWTPYVSDFGLARRTTLVDRQAMSSSSIQTTAWPLTQTGEIVGTPAYMAPEQAEGKAGAITVAADVYGLGAILYDLLTGRPPFQGDSPLDTILQVVQQEPLPPRQICKSVDRDLETICLKCLHKEPERRYASAREVAEDLRRFLRGEPIQARAVGRVERLVRWVRRQPVVAGLAFALTASVFAGMGLVGWQWYRAETNLAKANHHAQDADQQRQEAEALTELAEERRQKAETLLKQTEASFQMAHAVVNAFCVDVNDELEPHPGLQRLRKRLLASALKYHAHFLQERGRTPELLREQADTYANVGNLHSSCGDRPRARSAFEEALAIYWELHRLDPANLVIRRKLISGHTNLGLHQANLQDVGKVYRQGLELADRFLADAPKDTRLRGSKAIILTNLGSLSRDLGQIQVVHDYYQQALAIQEQLVKDHPNDDTYLAPLASTLHNLAVMRSHEGQGAQNALALYQRACDLRGKIAKAQPRDFARQADLAAAYKSLSTALRDCGRHTDAMEVIRKAVQIRETLVKENPGVPRFRFDLATTYNARAVLFSHLKDRVSALKDHEKARGILLSLVQSEPGLSYRQELAMTHFNIGVMLGALNRRGEERDSFQKSREQLDELIKVHPDKMDYRCDLGRTLSNLGLNLFVTGHKAEALLVLHEGIEHQRLAFDRAPQILGYRHVLNALYGNLSEMERDLNHPTESVAAILERQKLWPSDAKQLYRSACELQRTAARMSRRGVELSEKERAEQKRYSDLAMNSLRRAIEQGFKDADKMQQERDLELLRGREDFQMLVAGLKK